MSGCRVQMNTPTCRASAYLTRVGIQLAFQPASTRTYSQPILAAKSVYFFCAARLPALAPLDHHDQADRPGLIHDVSVSVVGAARSVTRSLSATVARSPMMNVRHGVVSGDALVSALSGSDTWNR